MTGKRFIFHKNNDDVEDTLTGEFYDVDRYRFDIGIVNKLNELAEENEQLKQELKTKCVVNKQYEENQRLIKMLDNVANYMQKQHKDMPIDDFVEWWNNIVTEGL